MFRDKWNLDVKCQHISFTLIISISIEQSSEFVMNLWNITKWRKNKTRPISSIRSIRCTHTLYHSLSTTNLQVVTDFQYKTFGWLNKWFWPLTSDHQYMNHFILEAICAQSQSILKLLCSWEWTGLRFKWQWPLTFGYPTLSFSSSQPIKWSRNILQHFLKSLLSEQPLSAKSIKASAK